MIEEKLEKELETFFAFDPHWIRHSLKVYQLARQIGRALGADEETVTAAALLHDVGIRISLEKYGDFEPRHQEEEGPPEAQRILERVHFPEEKIPHVLEIVGNHHSPGRLESPEFKAILDADLIVNIQEGNLPREANPPFLTVEGKRLYHDLEKTNPHKSV